MHIRMHVYTPKAVIRRLSTTWWHDLYIQVLLSCAIMVSASRHNGAFAVCHSPSSVSVVVLLSILSEFSKSYFAGIAL